MISISNCCIGRICLHIAAMVWDRQFKWHMAGIGREFSFAYAVRMRPPSETF
jgi:hypothetical protein